MKSAFLVCKFKLLTRSLPLFSIDIYLTKIDLTDVTVDLLLFQWLWASIQMEARANESMYLFEEDTENLRSNSRSSSCRKTPSSVNSSGKSRSHRRKRLREHLAKLAHEGQGDTPLVKNRRSSYSAACQQLDNTATESSSSIIGNVPTVMIHILYMSCCRMIMLDKFTNAAGFFLQFLGPRKLWTEVLDVESPAVDSKVR